MQDEIIKGTGNSRFLKSSIPEGTTTEEIVAMLRAGTFPVDFNGKNPEGIAQWGTDLNTPNLLSDDTANEMWHLYGEKPETVDEALSLFASRNFEIERGEYVGTGTIPASITFNKIVPELVIIGSPYATRTRGAAAIFGILFEPYGFSVFDSAISSDGSFNSSDGSFSFGNLEVSVDNNIISWKYGKNGFTELLVSESTAFAIVRGTYYTYISLNQIRETYNYTAFGRRKE